MISLEEVIQSAQKLADLIESELPATTLPLRELKVNFQTGDVTIHRG